MEKVIDEENEDRMFVVRMERKLQEAIAIRSMFLNLRYNQSLNDTQDYVETVETENQNLNVPKSPMIKNPNELPIKMEGMVEDVVADNKLICSICFDEPNWLERTVCNHVFCARCLAKWVNQKPENRSCPLCRKELPNFRKIVHVSTDRLVLTDLNNTRIRVYDLKAKKFIYTESFEDPVFACVQKFEFVDDRWLTIVSRESTLAWTKVYSLETGILIA
jgi:hypothetical protein